MRARPPKTLTIAVRAFFIHSSLLFPAELWRGNKLSNVVIETRYKNTETLLVVLYFPNRDKGTTLSVRSCTKIIYNQQYLDANECYEWLS